MTRKPCYKLLALTLLLLLLAQSLTGCMVLPPLFGILSFSDETSAESSALLPPESDDPGTQPEIPERPDSSEYKITHPELVYTLTAEDEDRAEAKVTALTEMIAAGSAPAEEFMTFYTETEDLLYALQQEYYVAYVDFCLYQTDKAIEERYLHVVDFYNDLAQRFMALYRAIEQSPYKDTFYADWTAEEIAEALLLADGSDAEMAALQLRAEELAAAQKALSDEEFKTGSETLFCELIEVNTAIAKKRGYNNYMDYAYDMVYTRDYTPHDVAKMTEYVKGHLTALLPKLEDKMTLASKQFTQADVDVLNALLFGTFEDETNAALIDAFYTSLGGEIEKTYRSFKESGYCYIAYNAEKSEEGAFTFYYETLGAPAIYFGPGYQSAFTFVHEFGHYYSFSIHGGEEISYDLCETQSQGGEWLFLAFLKENLSESAYSYLTAYRAYSDLLMVFVCNAVNEFEALVYTEKGKDEQPQGLDYDAYFRYACDTVYSYSTLSELMGYPAENYWRYVVIENPGYYISYAISLIPSLEIYARALSDAGYTAGSEAYERVQRTEGDFCAVLAAAGLATPFEEAAYSAISRALE